MKTIKGNIFITLLLAFIMLNTHAQTNNCAGSVNVLPINTGYNYILGTALPNPTPSLTVYDWKWYIDGNTNYSASLEEYINVPISLMTNTNWITDDPNINPSSGVVTKYRYDFCLNPGFTLPSITLDIKADDLFQLKLNGNLISNGFESGTSVNSFLIDNPNFFTPPNQGGENNITIEVKSAGHSSTNALDVKGEIRTQYASIHKYCRCRVNGLISGVVFEDANMNGVKNGSNDNGVTGVVLNLYKEDAPGSGTYSLEDTKSSASGGYYEFYPATNARYKVECIAPQTPYKRILTLPIGSNYYDAINTAPFGAATDYNFALSRLYIKAEPEYPICDYDPNCNVFNMDFQIVDNIGNILASSLSGSNTANFTQIFNDISFEADYQYFIPNKGEIIGVGPNQTNLLYTYPFSPNNPIIGKIWVRGSYSKSDMGFIRHDGIKISNANSSVILYDDWSPSINCIPNISLEGCSNQYIGSEHFNLKLDNFIHCTFGSAGVPCCLDDVKWYFDYDPNNPIPNAANHNKVIPDFHYSSPGTYKVRVEVMVPSVIPGATYSANGPLVAERDITILANPGVSISDTWNNCPKDITFGINNPNGFIFSNSSLLWDFGDGNFSSQSSPTHSYNKPGNYDVSLTVSDDTPGACISFRVDKLITVNDIIVDFTIPNQICVNNSITAVESYTNSTGTGAPSLVEWKFEAGGSFVSSPTHTYTSAGIYQVTAKLVFASCTKYITKNINVVGSDQPVISIMGLTEICLGGSSNFWLEGDLENINDVSWTFGDGQSSSRMSPSIYYTATGSYTITVVINFKPSLSGCLNSQTIIRTANVGEYLYCASCEDCIGSFAPEPGKEYVISAWVKESIQLGETDYKFSGISFYFEGVNQQSKVYKAKGPIIEGWQQIEESFLIPTGASAIRIILNNESEGDVYFDDVRIYPFDANLKSFVYDPITMRVTAELDVNNFATFYEYDEDGNLIRVKKETDRGIKTIQESVVRTKQE